jgi:hypothetical protein
MVHTKPPPESAVSIALKADWILICALPQGYSTSSFYFDDLFHGIIPDNVLCVSNSGQVNCANEQKIQPLFCFTSKRQKWQLRLEAISAPTPLALSHNLAFTLVCAWRPRCYRNSWTWGARVKLVWWHAPFLYRNEHKTLTEKSAGKEENLIKLWSDIANIWWVHGIKARLLTLHGKAALVWVTW